MAQIIQNFFFFYTRTWGKTKKSSPVPRRVPFLSRELQSYSCQLLGNAPQKQPTLRVTITKKILPTFRLCDFVTAKLGVFLPFLTINRNFCHCNEKIALLSLFSLPHLRRRKYPLGFCSEISRPSRLQGFFMTNIKHAKKVNTMLARSTLQRSCVYFPRKMCTKMGKKFIFPFRTFIGSYARHEKAFYFFFCTHANFNYCDYEGIFFFNGKKSRCEKKFSLNPYNLQWWRGKNAIWVSVKGKWKKNERYC